MPTKKYILLIYMDNKAINYNKTAYFIIDFCFIKLFFLEKYPCFSIKIKNILFCIYLILNLKHPNGIDAGVRDYAQIFYGWMSSETSAASHFQKKFQKKFQKDSYIDLKKLH